MQPGEFGTISKLVNRKVISVRGPDAQAFLQGLMTQDMKLFEKEKDRGAIFASFLNVKGKTMFDAIIAKPLLANQDQDDVEYWIDVADSDSEEVFKHFKKYAIRKKIQIQDVSHVIECYQAQTDQQVEGHAGHIFKELQDKAEMFESEEFPGQHETDVLAFVDPRTHLNGIRILCGQGSLELEDNTQVIQDHSEYDLNRLSLGIVESSKEIQNNFPLYLNYHQLHGVSTTKGCYIGQELVQRTIHTGKVRKQALPFIMEVNQTIQVDPNFFFPQRLFERGFNLPLSGKEIKDSKGIKVGKCLASQNNVGTAIFDMPRLYKNGSQGEYFIDEKKIVMWQPAWLKLVDEEREDEESANTGPPPTSEELKQFEQLKKDFKVEFGERKPGDPIPK